LPAGCSTAVNGTNIRKANNMTIAKNLTGIELREDEQGHWLYITAADGHQVIINIEEHWWGNFHTKRTVQQWADEQIRAALKAG